MTHLILLTTLKSLSFGPVQKNTTALHTDASNGVAHNLLVTLLCRLVAGVSSCILFIFTMDWRKEEHVVKEEEEEEEDEEDEEEEGEEMKKEEEKEDKEDKER